MGKLDGNKDEYQFGPVGYLSQVPGNERSAQIVQQVGRKGLFEMVLYHIDRIQDSAVQFLWNEQ